MAKVKGLSLQFLGGRITGDLVYQTWKGIGYLRTKPIPRYQRTPKQATIRNRFALGVKTWQGLDDLTKTLWRSLAKDKGMSGYEYFLAKFVKDRV
jgi:Family of unknown function (DUF6266)